ncbi:serine hydrolase [Streptosporangium canum]|uniref:serine hydrolase n=1 Tax=Streptosporangium canum TaxID=324952 RepID=UPI003687C60F
MSAAAHRADDAAAHQRVVQLHRRFLRRRDVRAGGPGTGKERLDNRFRSYRPQELVRPALSKPAKFEPGTDWSYANTDYPPALLLIEKVTGRSHAEEVRRILRPLGMSGTVVPGVRTPRFPQGDGVQVEEPLQLFRRRVRQEPAVPVNVPGGQIVLCHDTSRYAPYITTSR